MNFGAPALVAQLGQRRLEHVDPHPVVVHLDLHDVGLEGREARHRAGIGRRLGHDDVAGIEERAADEVDHLLAAGGDHQVVGLDHRALGGHHLHDASADVLEPVGRAVLERRGAGIDGHARHQRGEVLGREGRRVRQAGGQRDDLGPGGHGHHVAHRGGRHPARALGEQAAIALDLVGTGGRCALAGSVVYRHAPRRNASAQWTTSSTSSKAWASPRRSASGPFLPTLLAGALAARNVGLDFDDTDFAFLEQTGFLLGVVVAVAVLGVDRPPPRGGHERRATRSS